MTILLLFIIASWYFTSFILFVTESIILYFKPNAGVYAKIVSILLTSIIIFTIYFNFSFMFDTNNMTVFNSGQEEASSSKSNPLGVKIVSNTLGSTPEFDLRNISDVFMITAIGKIGLSAMSTVNTPKAKAVVGVSTVLSLGTVGAGYKLMNQARNNLRSGPGGTGSAGAFGPGRSLNDSVNDNSNNNPPSPSNDNFTTNSPLENLSSSESLIWVLFCIKLLMVIVLLLIILIIFINWTLNKLNSLNNNDNPYPHYFKFLSKENNDSLIRKAQLYSSKSGHITIKLLTLLVCFNLISTIYLVNEVMSFIALLDF